jgi:hypothetical protein
MRIVMFHVRIPPHQLGMRRQSEQQPAASDHDSGHAGLSSSSMVAILRGTFRRGPDRRITNL